MSSTSSARFSVLPFLTLFAVAIVASVSAQVPNSARVDGSANVAGTREYIVQPGDTLTRIAERELGSAARVDDILQLNPRLTDRHRIRFGERIVLPGEALPRSTARAANVGASIDEPPERIMAFLGELRDLAIGIGVVGMGVTTLVIVGAGIQLLVYFLVGGLFLWFGASVVRVPDVTFGRCFKVNAWATILAVLVAVALWVGVLALGAIDQATWGSDDFGRFLILMVLAFLVIQTLQVLIYVLTVKRGLAVGFWRACFACLFAIFFQAALGVVGSGALMVV